MATIFTLRIDGAVLLLDREDYEDLHPSLPASKFRFVGEVPQIKLACWHRWRRLDVALVGTKCGRRNGDPCDMRRINLIPAQRSIVRRYSS